MVYTTVMIRDHLKGMQYHKPKLLQVLSIGHLQNAASSIQLQGAFIV